MSAPRNSVEYFLQLFRIICRDTMVQLPVKTGCKKIGYCTSERRLDGLTALVTGGSDGIGLATAEILWRRGADVIITGRDQSKCEEAISEMKYRRAGEVGLGTIRSAVLDLSSLESVRRSAQQILASLDHLNILINNAGVMMPPFEMTEDGFELQFGVNHLGHFLLTLLLLPRILESAPARIVVVSSLAHDFYNNLDLDIMNEPKRYYPLHAYGRSKAANIMFARELATKLEGTGVTVYSLNPGYVSTKLYRYGDEAFFPGFVWLAENIMKNFVFKTPFQGAQTTIHCAICESTEKESGLYYEECKVKEVSKTCRDDNLCKDLWEKSLVWVGLGPNYNIFGSHTELPLKNEINTSGSHKSGQEHTAIFGSITEIPTLVADSNND